MKKQTKVLPELNWKQKLRVNVSTDVSVTITGGGKQSREDDRVLTIIIRDNLFQVFNTDYITFAVLKNRLYFRGTDKRNGYKVTVKNTSGYAKITIHKNEVGVYEPFVGDYSLKFDEFYELYYIEREPF